MREHHLHEKLRNAAEAIADTGRPIRDRLRSAFVYNLSGLQADEFPDPEGLEEYRALCAAFNRYGEAIEGEGSMPTTLWTMSDEEAEKLGEQVVQLARRYGEA